MNRSYSAQYIFTNTGPPLKRGIVTVDDSGRIVNIEDTGGDLKESRAVEFHNGIIVPGFVNCHAHIELSYLQGQITGRKGLGYFLKHLNELRDNFTGDKLNAIRAADKEMYDEGTVLCADICNTSDSFGIKKESRIAYINLLEVFGIDPQKAGKRIDSLSMLVREAEEHEVTFFPVPHSVYSLSLPLLRMLKEKSGSNSVTSVHFLETEGEREFIEERRGPLLDIYRQSGWLVSQPETAASHSSAVLDEITSSGNLILVHNTFATREIIREAGKRKNLYWCLCPCSNVFIENAVPPLPLLIEEGCEIVTGTDSLASNSRLSILEELKCLRQHYPETPLGEMIRWATINGARALGGESRYGKLAAGMQPGLVLLKNVDLQNMKLTPESIAVRLV